MSLRDEIHALQTETILSGAKLPSGKFVQSRSEVLVDAVKARTGY